jgi:glycosyltransferase involved in cell wall biosynthesis
LNNWFKEVLKKNGVAENKVITIKTNYNKRLFIFDSTIEEIQILFAGRQNTPKGLPLLLKAIKKAKFNKKVHLKICGPTIQAEENNLNVLINQLNQQIRVSRDNNVNHAEMTSIIQSSHLVILPSIDSEMCPLIILESQLNCIPVLGANHTGISDLIDDSKNGFLFERNSEKDLTFKLENLINSNQLFDLNKLLSENLKDEMSFLDKHLLTYNEMLD